MTKQVINRGAFEDDPGAETIYLAFGKVNNNFDDLYANADAEVDVNGDLVFPYRYGINPSYNIDGTLDQITATNGGTTWTLTYVYSGTNVDHIDAADGASTWTKTFTYNPDGTLLTSTGWV